MFRSETRAIVATIAAAALLVGAETATIAPLEKYTPVERRHWSFQPRKNVVPPSAEANPVDAFVREKLKAAGLPVAPEADRLTLIRRVTFDLTGLPPAPDEIDAFLKDRAPGAWERVVDRLLASPRYGEQWGRHWLDVVRFAESDGFEYDTHRTDAWRYRDYVIHSFNTDKPYNQFLTEQLAGDELAPRNETLRVASGFNRLGALRKNAGNQEVASSRNEVLTEMTNIVGAAMLGVTLGCARCHDHKFDPIRHTDYYRMQSYFAQTHEDDIPLASKEEQEAWKATTDALTKQMKEMQKQMKGLAGEAKAQMEQKIKAIESNMPAPLPALYSVANNPAKATAIHVLNRGEYQNKGAKVGMRPLGVLLPEGTPEAADTAAPRTQLAAWVTADENPLTARVMVNRIWHYHFGRGIVGTPNDFGRMGERPSHPELLDYLANQFVAGGWKVKPIHRLILTSATYKQASSNPAAEKLATEKDAANKLLWKFNRRRLEAEEIRDAMLASAGALNLKQGGSSVIVPVEPELINFLYKPSQWAVTKDAKEHDRRSVYLLQKRNLRLPFMEVFDSPDLQLSCARREQSTHAPQALEMLNGDLSNRVADQMAARLMNDHKSNAARIDALFRSVVGRAANPGERLAAAKFLGPKPDTTRLREFALAMFNTNSFLYVN